MGARLRVPRVLSVGATLVLGVLFVAPVERYLFMGWGYGVAAVAGAIGIMALVTMPHRHPFLALGPLVALGRVSYGLYLIQQPILKELDAPLIGVPLSIAVAVAMWYGVERPFLRLKHRVRRVASDDGRVKAEPDPGPPPAAVAARVANETREPQRPFPAYLGAGRRGGALSADSTAAALPRR